jgi:hypothetical protein
MRRHIPVQPASLQSDQDGELPVPENTKKPVRKSLLCCLVGTDETRFLRIVVLISYLVAAVICGFATYISLDTLALAGHARLFNSVADQSLEQVHARLLNLENAEQTLADVYRHGTDPDAWPNVVLAGFDDIAGDLIKSSLLETLIFMPLVQSYELADFEQFIFPVWDADPAVPATAALTPQSRGVFEFCNDYDSTTLVDLSCVQRVNATEGFNLPVTQLHSSAAVSISLFGYDGISFSGKQAYDSDVFSCVMAHPTAAAARGCVGYDLALTPDPAVEDKILNMRTIFPIVLGSDNSPPRVVGVIYGVIRMDVILDGVVPEFVDDLDFVIQWGEESYTYTVSGGKATNLRVGDHHGTKNGGESKHQEIVLGIFGKAF